MPQGSNATDSVQRAIFGARGLTAGLAPLTRTYALTASKTKEKNQSNQIVSVANELLVEVDAFSLLLRFFARSNNNCQEAISEQTLADSTSRW